MDSIGPRLTGSPAEPRGERLAGAHLPVVGHRRRRTSSTAPGATGRAGRAAWSSSRHGARARGDDARLERGDTGGGVTGRRRDRSRRVRVGDSAGFARWLGTVKGKLVLAQHAAADLPSGLRPQDWADSRDRISTPSALRDSARRRVAARLAAAHVNARALPGALERAGVAGVLSNAWSRGWGVDKIQAARATRRPVVRRLLRGLRPARATRRRTASIRACTPSPSATLAPKESPVFNTDRDASQGSEKPERVRRCSRRISTRGTPAAARPTTAPARSRCSRRCAS